MGPSAASSLPDSLNLRGLPLVSTMQCDGQLTHLMQHGCLAALLLSYNLHPMQGEWLVEWLPRCRVRNCLVFLDGGLYMQFLVPPMFTR